MTLGFNFNIKSRRQQQGCGLLRLTGQTNTRGTGRNTELSHHHIIGPCLDHDLGGLTRFLVI